MAAKTGNAGAATQPPSPNSKTMPSMPMPKGMGNGGNGTMPKTPSGTGPCDC